MEPEYEYLVEQARLRLTASQRLDMPLARKMLDSFIEIIDLFEFSPVGYMSLDRYGHIRRCNYTVTEALGLPKTELLDRRLYEYVPYDQRDILYRHLRRTAKTHGRQSCEIALHHDRPAWRHVRLDSFADQDASTGGEVIRLTMSDLTGQKKAQSETQRIREQLELATGAAGIGVWDSDLTKGEAYWNANLYELLGLDPRPGPEAISLFFSCIHPDDKPGVMANSIEAATAVSINMEFRIIRPDGSIRWLAAKGEILRDARGRAVRMTGVNFDITERKRIEAELARNRSQVEAKLAEVMQINEELNQYSYAVSHDLKTPLRAIHNYATFLSQDLADALGEESAAHLAGLRLATIQGQALIEDLLNFSRVGHLPLSAEAVDIGALAREVAFGLQLSDGVELHIADNVPAVVTDPLHLRLILQNLMENAVKFNDADIKKIEVGWQASEDGRIDLFVRDNGIGIDPRYHDQIFKVFQRLHPSTKIPGTGIGLAVVNKAALRLGGKVRVASRSGQGSTFYVNLPFNLPKEENGERFDPAHRID